MLEIYSAFVVWWLWHRECSLVELAFENPYNELYIYHSHITILINEHQILSLVYVL